MAGPEEEERRRRWAENLAEAYAARAALLAALGRDREATVDLERSLVLDGDGDPERRVLLARIYRSDPEAYQEVVRDLLASALADPTLAAAMRAEVLAELGVALEATGTWAPGGPEAWVAAFARAYETPAGERAPEPPVLRDFELTLSATGETVALSALEGPVVLDLWATWCGPCKQGLPHFDELARRYEGRATFLVVSVDKEAAAAERYLAQRGDHAFTAAWAGPGLMTHLGINGIPAYFVLDADRRVVGRTSGYGPGSTALDEHVERLLGD